MFRLMVAALVAWSLTSVVGGAQDAPSGQTLDQILALADRASPELAVAGAWQELAEVERAAAQPIFPYNPQLRAVVGQRRAGGEGDREMVFAVQQRIEIAGERGRRRAVARASAERWEAEREVVRRDIHRRVRSAFRLTLVARANRELAERLVEQQARVVAIAERRAELGAASLMEARLATVELLRARQLAAGAAAAELARRWALAELIGWRRSEPPLPRGDLGVPPALPSLGALMARLEEQPRLIAARARLAETEARQELARRDAAPEPTVGARFVSEGAPQGGNREWALLGSVILPLPLVQRNQRARAQADADRAIADAELDAWERRIRPRVRRLFQAARGARARARLVSEELLPALDAATGNIDRAFELGEIDLLSLLAARERMLRARFESLDAHRAYYEAVSALEALLGEALGESAGGAR